MVEDALPEIGKFIGGRQSHGTNDRIPAQDIIPRNLLVKMHAFHASQMYTLVETTRKHIARKATPKSLFESSQCKFLFQKVPNCWTCVFINWTRFLYLVVFNLLFVRVAY